MNLGNRYQLSEPLTTGAVETFRARDAITGEQVLIYVFECPAQPSNVPTIEWVLEAFKKIAPPPKEIVVNAGRYTGTAFVYLVTKIPQPAALEDWVASYCCYGSETQEIEAIPQVPGNAADSRKRSDSPGQNGTKVFQTLEPNATEFPSGEPSGSFTSFFRSSFKGVEPATQPEHPARGPVDQSFEHQSSRDQHAPASSRVDSPAGVFNSPADLRHDLSSPPASGTGEFTRFFRSPFSGKPSPDISENVSIGAEPQAPIRGEFTQTFGSVGDNDTPESQNRTKSLSLTQNAEAPRRAANSGSFTSVPPPGALQVPPVPPVSPPLWERPPAATPMFDSTASLSVGPVPTVGQQEPVASEHAKTGTLNNDAASRLFSPGHAPAPTVPAGASEYTMIIARPAAQAEPHVEEIPKPALTKPSFTIPPATATPPVQGQPAMTPLAIPQAAQPPEQPTAPKPAVSYWPLILTMTVLFFMAVLLVMYFVLKH